MRKSKLLIIDDDVVMRSQMLKAIAEDHEVVRASCREEALALLADAEPDLVLLDLGLPPDANGPEEGFRTLQDVVSSDSHVKIIVITGQSDGDNAIRAVGEGAYDFLAKPVDLNELKVILKRAAYVLDLERKYRDQETTTGDKGFEGMIGASPKIQQLFSLICKVAATDVPVLILGESGTGKEMAARAMHRRSSRREGPFIPINCGAIPENLLESELFGHEKGAFTGAHERRQGRVELANGGTLFLDEIGELPLALQVNLLRFLQEHTISRIGGRESIDVDVRVIAATNTDLRELKINGNFREDLYYRLAVVVLELPPLREREGDIALLAKSFLRKFATKTDDKTIGFASQALKVMEQYHWPGNVREMENQIKRALIMAEGKRVRAKDFDFENSGGGTPGLTLREARERLEKNMLERALLRRKGKITAAANDLGISRL
jgi:two-component system NtrC family response regulator